MKNFTAQGGDGGARAGFATAVWNITAIIITSLAVLLLIIAGFQIMVGGASSEQVEAVVDLGFDQKTAEFLFSKKGEYGITKICTTPEQKRFRINCDVAETEPRLHVEFKKAS